MDIKILKLEKEDIDKFISLIFVFEEVFEMKDFQIAGKDYLQAILTQRQFIICVAVVNEMVVGGLTAHILPSYYFQSAEVYVFDLGVQSAYQRKGIGKALIAYLKNYCENAGMKEIFVQADAEDTEAIDFYRSTGGIPKAVVHFSYPLNRP